MSGIQPRVGTQPNANVAHPVHKPAVTPTAHTPATTQHAPTTNQNSTVHAQQRPSHSTNPTGGVSFPTPQPTNPLVTQVLSDLSGKKGVAFSNALDSALQNPQKRAALISHFKLDSQPNKADLGRAMILEAGTGHHASNMMPVGRVILNRAIATNLAYQVSHGKPKNPPFSVSSIMKEKDQFASKADFVAKRRSAEGNSADVQGMVSKLVSGDAGTGAQASAFYFRRGHMSHQTFATSDGHSFARKYDSGVDYVNGNYLAKR